MRSLSMFMTIVLCSPLLAQPVPEVDQAEVLRLGDLVQHVGDGIRAGDADAYVAALSPPASDADKWFISVISMKGCAGCEKLKRDWTTNAALLALANPGDTKQSWSHYNVYDRDDRSQMFRFDSLKVSTYPTILVQPPRSGKYGEPSTVVFQSVYGGDPEKLARGIAQAIRLYVSKQGPQQIGAQVAGAVDPPWQPSPKVEPVKPVPAPLPDFDPTIPPEVPVAPPVKPFPWSSVVTLLTAGFSLPAAVAIVVWAVYYLRARRQAAGKPPVIDPATLDRLLEKLKQLSEQQRSST